MQLKTASGRLFWADSEAWLISRRRIGSRPRPWRPQPRWQQQRARRRQLLQPHARIPPQQVSCGDVPTTQRLPGHTSSYYPKDQCSGPRHCRYVRPGHLHPRPALSSPPPSAWNGPPDHQLKKIFRCAGRQVKLLLWRRLCFRREGAPQKGREFVQKAPLAELVPQCSIAPSSSRAGQSCSSSA